MATVHPLHATNATVEDDLDVRPLDLSECAPEERAAIEAALERVANGTARLVPHAEVTRHIEEQRRRHLGE